MEEEETAAAVEEEKEEKEETAGAVKEEETATFLLRPMTLLRAATMKTPENPSNSRSNSLDPKQKEERRNQLADQTSVCDCGNQRNCAVEGTLDRKSVV